MRISQTATLLLVPKNSSAQKKNREDNAKSHFTATKANPIPPVCSVKSHIGATLYAYSINKKAIVKDMTTQIWLMISNTNKILLNNKMQEKYRIIKVKSLAYFKRYACFYPHLLLYL